MSRREEKLKMKQLLIDAITLLCRSGMKYDDKFCIEALIAITLDDRDVVLININETIDADGGDGSSGMVDISEDVPKVCSRRKTNKKSATGLDCSDTSEDPQKFCNSANYESDNCTHLNLGTYNNNNTGGSHLRRAIKYEHESISDEQIERTNQIDNCSNYIAEETENTDDCFFVKSEDPEITDVNNEWSEVPANIEYNNVDHNKIVDASVSFQFPTTSHRKFRGRGRPCLTRSNWKMKTADTSRQCKAQYRMNAPPVSLQEQVQVDGEFVAIGCQLNKWQCNLCSTIYSSERVLREHVKAIHFHKMLGHCKNCGESFKWRHQLQKHKRFCPAAFNM